MGTYEISFGFTYSSLPKTEDGVPDLLQFTTGYTTVTQRAFDNLRENLRKLWEFSLDQILLIGSSTVS